MVFLCNPKRLIAAVFARLFFFLPDSIYLKIRFRLLMGQKLDLVNPKTFNEKLNWLKLYDRNPLYHTLVDKALVKEWVEKRIGSEHIIPTLGVWDDFDEIDFDKLPNSFVLKTTNGGGGSGVYICHDKTKIDKRFVKKLLKKSCAGSWKIQREWVYSGLKTRFIAEKFMSNSNDEGLVDYKFMCFNGEPKLLFMASDRYLENEKLKFDWYDMDLNHLPFKSFGYDCKNKKLNLFPEFEEMKKIARVLSQGIPQVRVDLYLVNKCVYFGEMTFYHDAGFVPLEPVEWDYKIGEMIKV